MANSSEINWIKTLSDGEYGIKYLTEDDYPALQQYCDAAGHEGIVNNSSFEHMKIETFRGDYGQYIITYHMPSMTLINSCAMHRLPIQLPAWGNQVEEQCWRIGSRAATLEPWRLKLLTFAPLNSLLFKHLYPIQINDALSRGATKMVVTTNSESGKIDASGKMFQADRALSILADRGCFTEVGRDVNIFNTLQSVWEVNLDFWSKR